MKKLYDHFLIKHGERVHLKDKDADYAAGLKNKEEAAERLAKNRLKMAELQRRLFAEGKQSLLMVLQAMDAGGKDGTIRHVMKGINPQGCRVTNFRAPSSEERSHDFLWRAHKAAPAKGMIGIFNRSHYEDVLVVRVHDMVPKKVWSKRYKMINDFEAHLADHGTRIVKFFLHISKDEQRARFQERIDRPDKRWKVNPQDFEERKYWDDYMKAFEDVLGKCSTKQAPWFVISSDRKWFRNLAISEILVRTLEEMDPQFPRADFDPETLVIPD